jgi:transcriptional regulator with XRE-family HTH domain
MSTPLERALRGRMDELNLTVADLSSRSGIARSTIYTFLDGSRSPTSTTLRALATGLSLSATELQRRIDGEPLMSPVADEQVARIVSKLPGIAKERLDAIEQVVDMAVQPTTPRPPRRRRSQTDPTSFGRTIGDERHQIRSHLGVANRVFRGSREVSLRAKRVA